MVYLKKLVIRDIKCFEEVSIDFRSTKDTVNWGLILGDNGLGKTTILRSIAMSLCGSYSLLDEIEGEWLRTGKLSGEIHIEAEPSTENELPFSVTTSFSRPSLDADTEIDQKYEPADIQWDKFFVCGYGAGRGVTGADTVSKYSIVDSVYTIFNYKQVLQNSEVVIRRLKDNISEADYAQVLHWVDTILMLPEGATKLEMGGLTVSGHWGQPVPLGALADGYQSTIAWFLDLLGWALLHDPNIYENGLSGIVLLDEIEQHLHPRWQRNIIPLLREIFPKMQFIITTHSPLVAANTGNISSDEYNTQLLYLHQEDTNVRLEEVGENLEELNAAQVLSSEAFGHIVSTNTSVDIALKEASVLAAKDNRTQEEEAKYQNIKALLKNIMFPKGKTLIERIIEREYYTDLEKQVEDFNKILDEVKNDQDS